MHLSNSMKQLMAYCYSKENAIHYEYAFDKRDESFMVRFFLSETDYLSIQLKGNDIECDVRHYNIAKSSYHPSTRAGYISKYFNKYRVNGSYTVKVPINVVLSTLEKIQVSTIKLADIKDKDSYKEWRNVYRATSRF